MMSRTQIVLDAELQRLARRRAADLGISLAEYIRRLVARDLGGPDMSVDPSMVFDLGRSGKSDIAREKDSLVAVAFGAGRARNRRKP